jgi:MMP 1-O-methyltransferase
VKSINIPADLDSVLGRSWAEAQKVAGHLVENEARFLGLLAACVPVKGSIVEIGSFRGRSTVMLAKIAAHYGLGPIVTIDPHNSSILLDHQTETDASSYPSFLNAINAAGISTYVKAHVAYSTEIAKTFNDPIRLLWIDGDHSYEGAKNDLNGFLPHLVPYGVVAYHDALNAFPGPIRVFVEDILKSDQFGPSGFVHSIAWAQFRPSDGHLFREARSSLARRASRLIPFVEPGVELSGMARRRYRFNRFRVPHAAIRPRDWAALVEIQPQP